MTPTAFDHLLFFVLVVVLPILGVKDMRDLRAELMRRRTDARIRSYRRGLLQEWLPTLLLAGFWLAAGRSLPELGIDQPRSWVHWVVLGAGVAVALLGVFQMRAALARPGGPAEVRDRFGGLEPFLPHTEREGRWFTALGLSAGVCEEVLYRGFMVAYLAVYLGLWPGALAAGAAFGFAHLYQGWGGVVRTGIFGTVLSLAYAWSGQLWGPMVVHAAVDVVNGRLARRALAELEA